MKNNWEKELLDKFGSDIKRDAMCPLEDFIRQLLAQKDKEHIEMTKELVSKKNKDCQRYLETQKNIPMGVSQWRNHGKKWYYWEFWAEQERTQLLEEFEEIVGEGIDDYFKGLIMIPNPQATKESLKQEIRDNLKALKDKEV